MFEGFKKFIARGNALDMAIGVIIGAAFGKIVSSLVEDIIMPPIGLVLGKVDFSSLFLDLSGGKHASLKAAKDAGAATINYGMFLNTLVSFLIIAIAVFAIITLANRMVELANRKKAKAEPTTKDCPFCCSSVPVKATKCAHCTSQLPAEQPA